jgi:hypothetical protein
MTPIFQLGCYGCIFHETGNSVQLFQNFGISGVGVGLNTTNPNPTVRHCSPVNTTFQCHYCLDISWYLLPVLVILATVVGFSSDLRNCLVIGELWMWLLCGTNKKTMIFQLLLLVEMNCRFLCIIPFMLWNKFYIVWCVLLFEWRMEAVSYCLISAMTYQSTRCHNAESQNKNVHRTQNQHCYTI